MKNPYYVTTLAAAMGALLAGTAIAGDQARGDTSRHELRADTDGDGRVSRVEATAAATERAGQWFDKLDANQDGYVTQEEVDQAREARRGMMRERMDEHFKTADINSDGQLSLDEVQAGMPRLAERFNAIDEDKNGSLSKEELGRRGARHKPKADQG